MIHTTCVISVLSYCFNLKVAEGNGLGMFRLPCNFAPGDFAPWRVRYPGIFRTISAEDAYLPCFHMLLVNLLLANQIDIFQNEEIDILRVDLKFSYELMFDFE